MYTIFTDFHHASLLNSFILLFEKRLKGKVYRPIGIEWAESGYWKVYDHPATQAQFLTLDQGYRPIDGTPPLNQFVENVENPEEGVYYCQDIDSGKYNKAITLEKFYELPIDIVIASMPQHVQSFKKLCESHKNKPKLIFQIGNAWSVEAGSAKNVMASAIVDNVPEGINFISYHQEFDLDVFKPDFTIEPSNNIYSFVNCFNVMDHFAHDWKLFEEIESLMPEWSFKSYGGQCRDGAAHGTEELVNKLYESKFVWHTKAGGDGYGHIIHNAPAVGRPLIVKKQYYANKMAEPLLVDGETCIVIDGLSNSEIVNKILYFSEKDRYNELSKNSFDKFNEIVDFNVEAEKISDFINKLL